MTITVAWLALLALFALVTGLGKRLRLIPVVSQLLLATLGLPLLMLWTTPLGIGASALLAPTWLEPLYGVAFTLLLGHILSDVVDLQLAPGSLQIALPSFFVPFFCGLACAFWLLPEQSRLADIAVGLLFALTAIPVLFLYVQHQGYPPAKIRQLLQAAIIMDLLCWLIFGVAQGSGNPATLLWPLLAAGLPLLLKRLPLRSAQLNGGCFLALLLLMQQLQLNALIFGIAYLLLLNALHLPLRLPLADSLLRWLQTWLAVPLILTFGLLQINWQDAWLAYSAWQFAALLLLPIISKLAGNWLGLSWAAGQRRAYAGQWRESLLLNTRGLTEIIFLNLLLLQQIISPALYFALMLMGLISTLLPALAGSPAANPEAKSRYEVS